MSSEGADAVTGKLGSQHGLVPNMRFPEFNGHSLHEVRLGDVTEEATTRNGNRLAPASVMGVSKVDGIVPMQERLVAGNISRYKNVRKNWFAYNPMRLNIGSIARWQGDNDVLVSPDYVVFRCRTQSNPTSLLPEYLDHFRSSTQWEAFTNESGDGGVRIRIYYHDIARMRLVLPDVGEQQKIADCLSSIDALIAAEVGRLDAMKDHKRGLMQQLFPAPGETTPRLRFPEFQDAGEWEEKEVGDIFTVTRGNVLAMTLVEDVPTDRKPYPVYSSQTKRAGLAGYYSDFLYENAITWTTDGANAGDVNYRAGKFYCTNVCGVLISRDGYANACVAAIINSVSKSHVSYVGNPKLMNGVMAKIKVPLPSVEEQAKIALCLSSADALIKAQGDKIDILKVHKRGLMQQLFPVADEVQA